MSWHKIPGLDGYEIKKDGSIRSWLDRGRNRRLSKPRIKTPTAHTGGAYVNIHGKIYKVAHLLAMTFIKPCPRRHRVVFKDGNTKNIKLSNLIWHSLPQRQFDDAVESRAQEIVKETMRRLRQ